MIGTDTCSSGRSCCCSISKDHDNGRGSRNANINSCVKFKLPNFGCVAAGTALARSEFRRTCITTAEALFKKTGAAAAKFSNLAAAACMFRSGD
jgi:hypothetical protein